MSRKDARRMGPFIQYAIATARQAVEEAKQTGEPLPENIQWSFDKHCLYIIFWENNEFRNIQISIDFFFFF